MTKGSTMSCLYLFLLRFLCSLYIEECDHVLRNIISLNYFITKYFTSAHLSKNCVLKSSLAFNSHFPSQGLPYLAKRIASEFKTAVTLRTQVHRLALSPIISTSPALSCSSPVVSVFKMCSSVTILLR